MSGIPGGTLTVALFASLSAAAIVLLVTAQVVHARGVRQRRGRIAGVRARTAGRALDSATPVTDVRKQQNTRYAAVDAIARRLVPRPALLRQRLEQTGRSISIGQYALACLAVGLAATLLRALVLDMPPLLSVLFGLVSGIGLPHVVVGHLIARRIRKFLATFPEAIDLIVRGLKSGLPVTEAIRIVGEEFSGPVGREFRQIADQVRFGTGIDDALWDAAKRIDLPDFKFFVVSLAVQRETGGNLAETLENLSDILRRRHQMKLKIRAMSSEARASAMILGSLPFLMFGLLVMINQGYVMTLFSDPRGMAMVVFGFVCLGMGIAVMWKMVRFEI